MMGSNLHHLYTDDHWEKIFHSGQIQQIVVTETNVRVLSRLNEIGSSSERNTSGFIEII